jgi:hypothetical protein
MNRYQTVTQSGEWHTRLGVGWNYQQKQYRKETTQMFTCKDDKHHHYLDIMGDLKVHCSECEA